MAFSSPSRIRPLALKLAAAVFVVTLVPLLVVAWVNTREVEAQSALREKIGLQRRAVEGARRLEERVGRLRAYAELLASNPQLVEAVASSPDTDMGRVEAAQAWDHDNPQVYELLVSTREANPWFQHVYLLSDRGIAIASSDRDDKPDMLGRQYDYRPYFRSPRASRRPFVSDVLKNANSPGTAIFVSAPIERDGVVAAVVVIKVDTKALHDVLVDLSVRANQAMLVDRFGVIVSNAWEGQRRPVEDPESLEFHPLAPVDRYFPLFEETMRYGDPRGDNELSRVQRPLGLTELWSVLEEGGSGAREFDVPATVDGDREPTVVGYAPVASPSGDPYGYILLTEPSSEFRGPLASLARAELLRFLVVVALVAAVMVLFFRGLSRRLKGLVEATQRVTDGDLELRVAGGGRDELGALAHSFNKMTEKLAAVVGSLQEQQRQADASREEAERANAAKSAFMAKVGREFRQPLAELVDEAERLLRRSENEEGAANIEALAELRAAAVRALDTAEELLDASALEREAIALRRSEVDIGGLLVEVADRARALASLSETELELELDDDLGTIETDRRKLRRIVEHLTIHAIRSTRHGEVTLRARRGEDGEVELSVVDTGIGLTAGQLERFFEPFSGADADDASGTGLGLAVTKRLADALGIELGVTSTAGAGTTVTAKLPRVPPSDSNDSSPRAT
jgi:signal transduction histidine kinase